MSEPWRANTLPLEYPTLGLSLLTGLFSLSFAFLWLRMRRLTRLVKRRDRQLRRLSATDPLTGLAHRKQLSRLGEQLIAANPETDISLLYINLDGFRRINDALGHDGGDELLGQVAHRFLACTGSQGTLARLGGDEFALLVPFRNRTEVRQQAEHLLKSLNQPFPIKGQMVSVSGSLGIAMVPAVVRTSACLSSHKPQGLPQSTRFSQLLSQADIAMSQARISRVAWAQSTGQRTCFPFLGDCNRSRYAFFHPTMQVEAIAQARLRRELKTAIVRQELQVRYQPIVDLRSSQTVGFEALVRWQHPEQGLLLPSGFLPLAEEMGLTVAIDRWVMETACEQLSGWCDQAFLLSPSLSVNLSATHLSQPDLVEYIQGLLACYPISPHQLNLEITESVMIANPSRVIDTLRQLKQLGVSVSLDDFGTGYSSLEYLHQFPVDVLKIDQSFVRHLGGSAEVEGLPKALSDKLPDKLPDTPPVNQLPQGEVIIRAILALAEALDMQVVAEGIEHGKQLSQLQQMRCSYGQGNLFSEPMNAPSAQALLAKQ